jgi:hypothetical protein
MVAYDYPLMNLFWTMLWFFLWIAWLFLLFRVFADIFRNHEMSGWGKALWTIFVIVVPFLGVLVYLIVHGTDMTKRDIRQAQEQRAAMDDYIRQTAVGGTVAGGAGAADELTKLAALRDQGVITEQEFAAQKARLLA